MKKGKKAVLGILISVVLVIVLGVTNIVPYFSVIPDMVKVGIDYISLKKYRNAVTEAALLGELNNTSHPFILAKKSDFERKRLMLKFHKLICRVILCFLYIRKNKRKGHKKYEK